MATQRKKKTILHTGSFTEATADKNVKGLDLQKTIVNKLVEESVLGTVNNRDYFPTIPTIAAGNISSPAQAEFANVPLYGLFMTEASGAIYVWIKDSESTILQVTTND